MEHERNLEAIQAIQAAHAAQRAETAEQLGALNHSHQELATQIANALRDLSERVASEHKRLADDMGQKHMESVQVYKL